MFKFKKHLSTSQFTAISVFQDEIKERVFLEGSGLPVPIDISKIHSPVCLNPLVIGIIVKNREELRIMKDNKILAFTRKLSDGGNGSNGKGTLAKSSLQSFDFIEISENLGVLLLIVKSSILFHLSRMETYRHLLSLYFYYLKMQKRNSFLFLSNLLAIYSYPRKVILNIIKTASHFNIFPMDLVCELDKEGIMLLGLNIKNRSIDVIIKTRKMVIVNSDAANKNIIYGYSENHNKELIKPHFDFNHILESETFNFPVPTFASSYMEISCIKHVKLGSHYLLICRVINKKILKSDIPLLYHVSTIHQFYLEKKNDSYPVV